MTISNFWRQLIAGDKRAARRTSGRRRRRHAPLTLEVLEERTLPTGFFGLALGVAFAVWKFSKSTNVKSAALGVMGTVIAKQIPYVQDALA